MKKRLVIALLLCTLTTSACGSGKPRYMDSQTYELAKRAVETMQDYLNTELSAKEAYNKMDSIYNRLSELEISTYKANYYNEMITIKTSGIRALLMMDDANRVYEDMKEMKEYIGMK